MLLNNKIEVSGIEKLNDMLKDWGLDFMQLDRGVLETSITKAEISGFTLQHIMFNKKIWQRGIPPNDAITFGLLTSDGRDVIWNNKSISSDTMELFSSEDKFDVVSPAGFAAFTFSMNAAELELLIEQCGIDLDIVNLGHQVVEAQPHVLRRLKALSVQTLCMQPFMTNPSFAIELKTDINYILMSAIELPKYREIPIIKLPRNRLVNKAINYILENITKPILVGELCSELHTSARTLTRCFQNRFNLSPKEVITYIRLQAFRSALIENPHLKIYQVASLFGFWHLSKLSQDYKLVFGELPTKTRLDAS